MADHRAKVALFDALTESAKALANGRRAELVDVLLQGERSVEDLATEIHQSVANTSQHLQRLLRAGLVRTRRDGNRIHYSLASPSSALCGRPCGRWPSSTWSTSGGSPRTTSVTAARWPR